MTKSFNYMEDALGEGAVMILAEHGATIVNAIQLQAQRFEDAARQAGVGAEGRVYADGQPEPLEEMIEYISVRPTEVGFEQMQKLFTEQATKCRDVARRVETWREAANGTVDIKE